MLQSASPQRQIVWKSEALSESEAKHFLVSKHNDFLV
jgi:hypothetical protein